MVGSMSLMNLMALNYCSWWTTSEPLVWWFTL